MGDAEVAQGLQGERGQILESAHAVLGEGSVWTTGFAKVGELAKMQEIDARTHRNIVGGVGGQRKPGGRGEPVLGREGLSIGRSPGKTPFELRGEGSG